MDIQIKFTKQQYNMLLERLGCEEAIDAWLVRTLETEIRKLPGADEKLGSEPVVRSVSRGRMSSE